MLLRSSWSPRLSDENGPIYRRLAIAISEDIQNETLSVGSRLPAHRDLSYCLSVSLSTVTKAYSLLKRKGIVHAERGRGMFVSADLPMNTSIIDLSINLPPAVVSNEMLAQSLLALSSSIDSETFNQSTPPQGHEAFRSLFAKWLQQFCPTIAMENLILCNSSQSAILQVLSAFDPVTHCVATDNLSYPPLQNMAARLGIELLGMQTDREGILPSALVDMALYASKQGKNLILFSNQYLQNPTGKIMTRTRVKNITRVCRDWNVWVVEDDVYASFAPENRLNFLAALPERTFYVTGISKILTAGVKLGFISAPCTQVERISHLVATSGSTASVLVCMLLSQWIENEVASDIIAMSRHETIERANIARATLKQAFPKAQICGLHAFLPMSAEEANRLASDAAELHTIVTPPAIALDGDDTKSGIRVCLGSPSRKKLEAALSTLAYLEQKSW